MRLVALSALLVFALPVALRAEALQIVALPIVVHSSESDPRYVSEGLADMLSARLEQLRGVRVVIPGNSEPATVKLEEALALGRAAGGDYVIFGAFTQFGDGASLDVQCVPLREQSLERTLAARRIFVQSGAIGEIIPKLDELVDRVAFYLNRRPVEAGLAPVAASPAPPTPARGPEEDRAAELRALRERVDALEQLLHGRAADSAAMSDSPGAPAGPPES
ncbi:MAG: hypothetical protein HRU02_14645 [Myxococcales bacterium]|nr:hypothetical protein [Myxococcales bacterium]